MQLQGFTRCCNQCKLSSNHNQFVYKIIFSSLKIHKLICFDRHLLWVDEFLFYPIRSLRKQAQQWLYGMFYIRHFTKRHSYSADVGRRNAAWYSAKVWSKSNVVQVWIVYTRGQLYMYIQGVQVKYRNQHTGTWLEAEWPHGVCVIAQQYSFATCMSLGFHTARKISACCYKVLLFQMYLFLKIL